MSINSLKVYEFTHHGGRKSNQDYFVHQIDQDWAFFLVADGLGGHAKGEEASRCFSECVKFYAPEYADKIRQNPEVGMENLIHRAAAKMRQDLHDTFGDLDAHTTFVMAWLNENHLISAHVGDSRLYRITPEVILWRTPDHSVVQGMFEEGFITEEEMGQHPMQNHLLNTVGTRYEPIPEVILHPPLAKDETLILCSDGFWENVASKELVRLANSATITEDIQQIARRTVEHNPWADNITVQVVVKRE